MEKWEEYYKSRFISAEEAAQLIKNGDYVVFSPGRETVALGRAIANRKAELKNVEIFMPSPTYDFGWYAPGYEESFQLTIGMPTAICQEAVDARRVDINFFTLVPFEMATRVPDVLLLEVSPPDEKGFLSFGNSVWTKKKLIREAKLVIAEVNKNLIRTYGDNFIHVQEIDYFVEHVFTGREPGKGSLAVRELKEPEAYLKDIAAHVSTIIKDRDTIQIGVGRATEPLVKLGLLAGKQDLGWHSEATPPGVITLVKEGVINGRYKTVNPGRAVVTSLGGSTKEEMLWANNNPLFWLVDVEYLEDVRVIAAHDNMVSINNALAVDFTGQVAAETLGTRRFSLAGGQIAFTIGAWLSRGGRAVTVLPSTAQNGKASRIVPMLPQGTQVTVQANLAYYVATEYGIVNLRGKSVRQRALELISIAHPDFRAELRKEAEKLFWP